MSYRWNNTVSTEHAPARRAVAVTPNDSTDLAQPCKALWVGVLGDVSVDTAEGDEAVVFQGVQGILPVACRRVRVTGTTATAIVALF
jgi:hypothetical protein